MGAELRGSPAADLHGSLDDLVRFAGELLEPRLIAPETLVEATSVQFPGLAGVIPDLGRFDPNDWGLGFELKDGKHPHWSGSRTSPRTFGHFGGSGTFLWVDPEAALALACLTDREFDAWAHGGVAEAVRRRARGGVVASLVVGEERPDELVERRLVAARHHRRRHRPHGRRSWHAHRERHLSEVRTRMEDARRAAAAELARGEHARKHDVEAVARLALDDGRRAGR